MDTRILFVYDGPDDESMLIGQLLGSTSSHKVMKSISSSEKTMFVDLKKQISFETIEFVASIKYKKIDQYCQSWLSNNKLMSPNSPNINCSWIITRKFGSYITLDFEFIEVKPIGITSTLLSRQNKRNLCYGPILVTGVLRNFYCNFSKK